jgi:MAF protein
VDAGVMSNLVLASGSPRRRELLRVIGWQGDAAAVEVDEVALPGEGPEAMARRLAEAKAAGAASLGGSPALYLGADTVVVDGEQILGKPQGTADAERMLLQLRGREHQVLTAIALLDASTGRRRVEVCRTAVPMRHYRRDEVEAYVASGGPLDKAGSYGIQDGGFNPVDLGSLTGCFANVMGLPLCHLARGLRSLGVPAPGHVPGACQAHTGYRCSVYEAVLEGKA